MILNNHEHNPLKDILSLLPSQQQTLTISLMHDIRSHLFRGGVCCETDDEFEQCLEVLRELGILELERIKNGRILIKRGIDG